MPQLSSFVYGMILFVGIMAVFFGFASMTMNQYGVTVPTKYNQTFTTLSNMTAINEQTEALKVTTLDEDQNATSSKFGVFTDLADIVGIYFTKGYRTAKLIPNTLGVFNDMVDASLDTNVNMYGSATLSLRFIVGSLILMFIVFGIASILLKWWL